MGGENGGRRGKQQGGDGEGGEIGVADEVSGGGGEVVASSPSLRPQSPRQGRSLSRPSSTPRRPFFPPGTLSFSTSIRAFSLVFSSQLGSIESAPTLAGKLDYNSTGDSRV